jgi:hypothetical protein
MAPLRIGRRFADVRRARCDVDERHNLLVLSGLRNDRASVVVADKDDRMWLMVERPRYSIDVVREPGQRILHCDDAQALGLQ